MALLEAAGAEASGKTTEEVATTTTTTITTEAEGRTEATAHQATEAGTTMVIMPQATTPQAIAIRAMVKGQVEDRLGEAEVSCCCSLHCCLLACWLACVLACSLRSKDACNTYN